MKGALCLVGKHPTGFCERFQAKETVKLKSTGEKGRVCLMRRKDKRERMQVNMEDSTSLLKTDRKNLESKTNVGKVGL